MIVSRIITLQHDMGVVRGFERVYIDGWASKITLLRKLTPRKLTMDVAREGKGSTMSEAEQKVWRYILTHRQATPEEVHRSCGVSLDFVKWCFSRIGTPEHVWRNQ
jgi:hypothetical protein